MAKISITNLPLSVIIGTTPEERKSRQTIHLDLSLEYDSAKPEQSDNLADALDYEILAKKITERTQATEFHLLEKLARFIITFIKEETKILKATVTISKPNAVAQADGVSVSLTDEG